MKLQAKNTLPCFLWMRIFEPNEAGDVYLYQYNETEDGEPVSATSKMMTNTKLPLMLLMNGWIPRNLMNQTSKSNSDTKREGVISFPFFSFTY